MGAAFVSPPIKCDSRSSCAFANGLGVRLSTSDCWVVLELGPETVASTGWDEQYLNERKRTLQSCILQSLKVNYLSSL